MLALRGIGLDKRPECRRNSGIFTGEVGTDDLPTVTTIARCKNDIRSEIQQVRIDRRENQRRGAIEAILPGTHNDRRNVTRLSGRAVEHRTLATINQIRMQRIGRYVAAFFYTD